MHLNIEGKHLNITPAINTYVKSKSNRIARHFTRSIAIRVVLSVEKKNQTAEATITVNKHHFHNCYSSKDLYGSIDLLFDKLERQVRRYKETFASKRRVKLTFAEEATDAGRAITEDRLFGDLVELSTESKPMHVLEAVLQLSLPKSAPAMAYRPLEASSHVSFLLRKDRAVFDWIHYDSMWERNEVVLTEKNEVEVRSVRSLVVPTERIEDAADYMSHNNETWRFFVSVRTHAAVLLVADGKKKTLFVLRDS